MKNLFLIVVLLVCFQVNAQIKEYDNENIKSEAVKAWKKKLKEKDHPAPTSFAMYEIKYEGERMRDIARKFKILPERIYEHNPEAVNGLHAGMSLRIPSYEKLDNSKTRILSVKAIEITDVSGATITKRVYELKTGTSETLDNLALEYQTTVMEIIEANKKVLANGLTAGSIVKIITEPTFVPANSKANTPDATEVTEAKTTLDSVYNPVIKTIDNSVDVPEEQTERNDKTKTLPLETENTTLEHIVAPKETLYSLAKKYNTTVDALKNQNPEVAKNGLKVGQKLKFSSSAISDSKGTETPQKVANQSMPTQHTVAKGETLKTIALKYKITVSDLLQSNEFLANKDMQEGDVLQLPKK